MQKTVDEPVVREEALKLARTGGDSIQCDDAFMSDVIDLLSEDEAGEIDKQNSV